MRSILSLLFILCSIFSVSQNKYYGDPLKIPLYLSASFGELRPNHFHSGIDIKTQGTTGLLVYSVADGYICRISVSPSGFGNALYIAHTNGTTSVYGHLNNFRNDITEYVRKIQYEKKTFALDISLTPEIFPVLKGDMIANSGNTGSSGGPHLHFELRDSKTENTLNPLLFNLPIVDHTPPKIFSLKIMPLSEISHVDYKPTPKKYPVVYVNGKYILSGNPMVPVFGKIGFEVQANDYFDDSQNKCGLYSIELKVDGERRFLYKMDNFSFADTRFINSFTDYGEYISNKTWFQKTWIDPGTRWANYSFALKKGIIEVNDQEIHLIKLILKDIYGNSSEISFDVEGKFYELQPLQENYTQLFEFDKPNSFQTENFEINLQNGTLYNNLKFIYKKLPVLDNFFSDIHIIGTITVPLHKSADVRLKTVNLSDNLFKKALLVNIDTLTGNFISAGGEFKDGWVTGKILNFGNYAVSVDTIPPKMLSLSIRDKSILTESNQIRFRIADDLSGIKSYEGLIDGKWVLFEYDQKSNIITYLFDKERFEFNKTHKLVLTVKDNKENSTVYEATFRK